jgi:hypothetical protein
MTDVDMKTVVPVSEMTGYDAEETDLLKDQLARAKAYLTAFKWCHGIKEAYFGDGVGKIVAAFLFRIDSPPDVDEWIWVVTGDIPSVYMDTYETSTPALALDCYCFLMEEWVAAVRGEGDLSLDEVYPVDAPATPGNADALERRIEFIRTEIIPKMESYVEE